MRKIYTSENGLVKEAVAILRLKYKKWQKPPTRICRWLDCSKKLLYEQSSKNQDSSFKEEINQSTKEM